MRLNAAHTQLAHLVGMIVLATVTSEATVAHPMALPGCIENCGNIPIPYPFGIGLSSETGQNCSLDESFNLTCFENTTLRSDNFTVSSIFLHLGLLNMSFSVAKSSACFGNGGSSAANNLPSLRNPAFTISSEENSFITVGCNSFGYLDSYRGRSPHSTSCNTRCKNDSVIEEGRCSGTGCCEVDISCGMRNISVEAYKVFYFSENVSGNDSTLSFSSCSYAFIAPKKWYNFPIHHFGNLSFEEAPLVIEWAIGNETCEVAQNKPNFACQRNSVCENVADKHGYRCKCKTGYEGNPYLPHGCIGKDPQDYSYQHTMILIGVGAGFMALFMIISWLYLIFQKRKVVKLKEKFFRQNGGFILQQRLSTREDTSQLAQIFTPEQLKRATNDYDASLVIGKGSFGTVIKGSLSNSRTVAIKKSKVVDESQVEQFINEVVVLSQINHRNVVKLLGCCLETEVPLLVYEFVNNGTLFDYIHDNKSRADNKFWRIRLRIAAETAGALSYLHSAASIPIIHRDVKTTNILLDETYTAKVSDFGASRLIPLDQSELATMLQGTIGCLDPEYMQTSQLNDKSDVYSFGVVLVELLTGEISFDRPEEQRSLAVHFLSYFKEDRLFEIAEIGLVNEENKEEVKEVAALAAKGLRLRGDERPSMKEVAMELEGIRIMEKHP